MTFAGAPATTLKSGTGLVTTEFAPTEALAAEVADDRALAGDHRVVGDADRREVVALQQHRHVGVPELVVAVDDDRRLAEHAPLPDLSNTYWSKRST